MGITSSWTGWIAPIFEPKPSDGLATAPSAITTPGALREHRVDLVYGICTLVYVSILSLLVARSFQAFTNGWLSRWLPGAQDASYVLAGILLLFFFARIAKELRRE